jgi:pimeloyl-ACP methyl ester carboxylesterase
MEITMNTEEHYHAVNGVTLHTVEAGDTTGDCIIFLHGFPEYWYGWKNQFSFFTQKGFRVVVPDQRGYNLSSKPSGVRAYSLPYLVGDIVALIHQLGNRKVVLVGHDWGGVVAWHLALHHPDLVCRAFDFAMLWRSMRRTANRGAFSSLDMATYKKAWRQPGALTAMLNWYRAYKYNRLSTSARIQLPVLLLWGKKDRFLLSRMAQDSIRKCAHGKLVMVDDATHWIHHEHPHLVNTLIHDFITKQD